MTELENKLKNLPEKSGVYIMKDAGGKIIYVGKAKALKNRVKQYFTNKQRHVKVAAMVSNIADLEYIICDSETEALILECNLIKKHMPYYNILLKDGKHYPYVRVDFNEYFPVISIVRKVKRDGAKYFGPYVSAWMIKDILEAVYKIYPIRSCKKDIKKAVKKGERPCLNYQMGRCVGACTGRADEKEYLAMIGEITQMLDSNQKKLKRKFTELMQKASENMEYEKAADYRDKIYLIDKISSKQKAGYPNLTDRDVFGVFCGEKTAVVQAFLVREGKLNYTEKFYFNINGDGEEEIMSSFLKQYYMDSISVPKTIHISCEIEDMQACEEWLSGIKGSKVSITIPQIGENKKLKDMAVKNAADAVKLKEGEKARNKKALAALGSAIGVSKYIGRMECYDISNTQGTDSVASMVVFTDGAPDKKQYRRFKIKTVEGSNDFESLKEALTRRLIRGLQGDKGFERLPDLLVIDGGKGQLSSTVDALYSLGCEDIAIVGLAKREEEIFLPGRSDSIMLKRMSPEFKMITRLRDEAHRFAITYHRSLREKRQKINELNGIAGVGEERKKILLKHFGSMTKLKNASLKEIEIIEGIPKNVAKNVFEHFNK